MYETVQQQVVNHILANGGSDPESSGFIFHFQTMQSMLTCRNSMRTAVPAIFHIHPILANRLNLQYGTHIPIPIPMAEAWIVIKTAVMLSEYKEDDSFFIVHT